MGLVRRTTTAGAPGDGRTAPTTWVSHGRAGFVPFHRTHAGRGPAHSLRQSQNVINSVTKWMPGWKRKGRRKSDGKPVMKCVQLLKEIDQALVGTQIQVRMGAAAMPGMTSTRRRMTVPGPRPRPTSREWPCARAPGYSTQPGLWQNAPAPAAQAVSPAAAQAPPRPAQVPTGRQQSFGGPTLFDEPDLFSELDEDITPAPGTDEQPGSDCRGTRTRTPPAGNARRLRTYGSAAAPGLHRNRQLGPDLDPGRHDDVPGREPGRSRRAGTAGCRPAGRADRSS